MVTLFATAAVSLGSFGLLLTAFDQASPSRWLRPTPDVMAMVSQCNALPERGARDACTQRVVTALVERQRDELVRVARR